MNRQDKGARKPHLKIQRNRPGVGQVLILDAGGVAHKEESTPCVLPALKRTSQQSVY